MSVIINPAIALLEDGSLMKALYEQLYANFINAQDNGLVVDGNELSIRLKNTSYDFANAIATSVGGDPAEGTGGGVLIGYVQKSGSNMTGLLRANNSFEAGESNVKILSTYSETVGESTIYGIHIDGMLRISSGGCIAIGGQNILSYNEVTGTVVISGSKVDLGLSELILGGSITIGSTESGLHLSNTGILIGDKQFWNASNSNLSSVDWNMQNGAVSGNLSVSGTTTLSGALSSLYGSDFGYNGSKLLYFTAGSTNLSSDLIFGLNNGIKAGGKMVLGMSGNDLLLSGSSGQILLGGANTTDVRLLSGIKDTTNSRTLISPNGDGYFPNSFRAAHNLGDDLLKTYRISADDEGVVITKKMRFGTGSGAFMFGDASGISFVSGVNRSGVISSPSTKISHVASSSLLKIANQDSDTASISTSADFFLFSKPLEAKTFVGINGSFTRLQHNTLFFNDSSFIQYIQNANSILHNGKTSYNGDLSSESFASGFAGYGWGIIKNMSSGNYVHSIDELVVRKKMKVYEFDVQIDSATNGSMWVSDSFAGDTVTPL